MHRPELHQEKVVHHTNPVWNNELQTERSRKNSRTALTLVGVTMVLVIALVVAVALYLPNVRSYSMDSFDFSLPRIDLSELFEGTREPVPEPEPETPPAERLSGADLDFINVLAAYAIELAYISEYEYVEPEAEREIHQMFLPNFQHLAAQVFDSHELNEEARWAAVVLEMLSRPELDRIGELTALYELSAVVLRVNDMYDIFGSEPEVLEYYEDTQQRTGIMLEVEYDLQAQLVGAGTEWSEEYGCQAVYYTNNTPYVLDIRFVNEFVTDEECYFDEYSVGGLAPGATEAIPLYGLSEVGNQDHTWTAYWVIDEVYIGGIPTEEYFE